MNEPGMKIYRLVPDAADTDPNWDLARPAGEVVVRARSPADARIVAAEAEVDFLNTKTKPGDGVSTSFASAFREEKLYRVVEDDNSPFPGTGPRTVLEGPARPDTIKHGLSASRPNSESSRRRSPADGRPKSPRRRP